MSEEREEELATIQAIFPEIILSTDHSATLELPVKPTNELLIRFIDQGVANIVLGLDGQRHKIQAHIEHDIRFKHLPPLTVHIQLPSGYPETGPPLVSLSSAHGWLPSEALQQLQEAAHELWEEYGRCQMLFAYIDHLQQCAEQGFNLDLGDGPFTLPLELEAILRKFDVETTQSEFDSGTYDCGVCLERKTGQQCYKLQNCSHIFCKQCLQDFYNNAITEGDVNIIRCLDPDCSKDSKGSRKALHFRELLLMGVKEPMARRYVELRRKKKLESDKTTVYCPRTWCQYPARTNRYPPIPENLDDYADLSDEEDDAPPKNGPTIPLGSTHIKEDERLAICEKCEFAFCKTCNASWHGSYVICRPRDGGELTAEEKASYDYILKHTSPCPTCSSPTQKTWGCNHMQCSQCRTHFCYLCGAWLDPVSPYKHFNTAGSECFQRLWELEEGDEGQAQAGVRAFEAMAVQAAREAQREEDEAAAAEDAVRALEEPVQRPLEVPPAVLLEVEHMERVVARAARLGLEEQVEAVPPQRATRRRRNPFPAGPQAQGAALAVRAHERQAVQGQRQVVQGPQPMPARRQEDGMRHFIELAQRDEEDGWDSDEFAEDDANWHIR